MTQNDSKNTQVSRQEGRFRVSVPGRTEVAGNHQDHQGGCVIASAIDRRIYCDVHVTDGTLIQVDSHACTPFSLDMNEENFATPRIGEINTTKALVRGMAAQLIEQGVPLRGCKLTFESSIPPGAGLSSSAAFELCSGAALLAAAGWGICTDEEAKCTDAQAAKRIPIMLLAQMALRTERDYFGKPCGIMDQVACAYGGITHLDFLEREHPVVKQIELPASWSDFAYFLVDCGSGHEESTQDYARIALDMQAVAELLGLAQLRDMEQDDYLACIEKVQDALGDLAALRGLGYYSEYELVKRRVEALCADDMPRFVHLTERSGVTSAEYLQNVGLPGTHEQAMVALALCRTALDELSPHDGSFHGSARIHGGGFGGTIQVIVPGAYAEDFKRRIEGLLHEGCCLQVDLGAPGVTIEELI